MTITCPHARWDPLGPQTEPRMAAHDIVCFHTMVGTLEGVRAMFKRDGYGGTESHFGTGGSGKAYQWQDLEHQADANLDGNPRVISIETEDMGEHFPSWSGSNVPPWTPEQVDKHVEITAWLCKRFDIPPTLIPDTKPGRRGIGYHRQGIDGNFNPPAYKYPGRVPGGEKWSDAFGKVCPGDKRIKQLIEEIIPRVKELVAGKVNRWEIQARWGGGDHHKVLAGPATLAVLGERLTKDESLRAGIRWHRDQDHRILFIPRKVQP